MEIDQTIRILIMYSISIIFMIVGIVILLIQYAKLKKLQKNTKYKHEKAVNEKTDLSIFQNEVNESMRYAVRLTNNLLPTNKYIKQILPNSFIFFRSKEIVSGDFYWFTETENKIFVAAIDCTGHGIPGAFLSIIGLTGLKYIKKLVKASDILHALGLQLLYAFGEEKLNEIKDGMDASVIAIHKHKKLIEFSGAINKLFIVRDDNIIEFKGDKFSISPTSYKREYFNHEIPVQSGDMLYIFSDGYTDQFGGPDDKKFKYRRFRHMLLANYKKSVEEQKNIYAGIINNWIGPYEQFDDILLIGIKIE